MFTKIQDLFCQQMPISSWFSVSILTMATICLLSLHTLSPVVEFQAAKMSQAKERGQMALLLLVVVHRVGWYYRETKTSEPAPTLRSCGACQVPILGDTGSGCNRLRIAHWAKLSCVIIASVLQAKCKGIWGGFVGLVTQELMRKVVPSIGAIRVLVPRTGSACSLLLTLLNNISHQTSVPCCSSSMFCISGFSFYHLPEPNPLPDPSLREDIHLPLRSTWMSRHTSAPKHTYTITWSYSDKNIHR